MLIRRLIIVLQLEIVPWSGDKIGNPTNMEQATTAGVGTSAPQTNGQPAGKPNGAAAQVAKAGNVVRNGSRGSDMGPIFPIEGLSPYQNK